MRKHYLWLPLLLLLVACGSSDGSSSQALSETKNGSSSSATCLEISQSSSPGSTSGTDPLLSQLWYLNNTGQDAFSSSGGKPGEDISLPATLWSTATGKGVRIAVLDNNIDYNHPDLIRNLNTATSCRFAGSNSNGDHATSVAGIIAAEKDNLRGAAGVAPDSQLSGFNILSAGNSYTEWSVALGHSGSRGQQQDIFNQSFGYNEISRLIPYDETFHAYYQQGTEQLRNGLGALYFKAAGNFHKNYGSCSSLNTNASGLPCQNVNMDPENNAPYNMVVAALNADGVRSSYSSSGSGVIFSAPGGEFGVKKPAIIAPDDLNNSSSAGGYDGYTSRFNGTSSAAPIAAGVAALILERRPDLGWRDVRHILLATADKVDPSVSPVALALSDGSLTAQPAWQTNSGGYAYHNSYGFGRINAMQALTDAAAYGGNLPAQQRRTFRSGSLNLSPPDNSVIGTHHTLNVGSTDNLTVESVQIRVQLSHNYLSDLQIQLTSPGGMTSVLMTPQNGMTTSVSNREMVLLSQAFYGETAPGNWRLEVFDTRAGNTGTLHSWSMTLYGH